jgi:hypothetical protein
MNPEEYRQEEASRVENLKKELIKQLQERTPNTFGDLDACLVEGLMDIEDEKKEFLATHQDSVDYGFYDAR